ncbi:hypothetical protein [Glutamicibacter sp. MCAF14]|uniref:hypothetical protein n=1 Tax=Glutamicibacter sp. MCAF14 TaxID=3233043 RepID=UPI003F8DD769
MSVLDVSMADIPRHTHLRGSGVTVHTTAESDQQDLRISSTPAKIYTDGLAGVAVSLTEVSGMFVARSLIDTSGLMQAAVRGAVEVVAGANQRVRSADMLGQVKLPSLTLREKVSLFFDSASSVLTLGSEKPTKSTEEETAKRIARRRESYRRYTHGRES